MSGWGPICRHPFPPGKLDAAVDCRPCPVDSCAPDPSLTLQLGTHALASSTTTYFGCITLNGVKKRLLTVISMPPFLSVSSSGKPSFAHREGGYVHPSGADVWNSFWSNPQEENPTLTWIVGNGSPGPARDSASWRRDWRMPSREGEAAQ
ncbi:hypothetical protein Trco_007922 [Trichoderma cornu-damae]|uniref:Uncharacterized protein n=1 Tax=Trichoderma cornu-damae TaxID=654480 RepID=A0A9P8QIU4_9HYPO|nr:hypothetical protein Trco_007922 [Trichoderma cornu-damae]